MARKKKKQSSCAGDIVWENPTKPKHYRFSAYYKRQKYTPPDERSGFEIRLEKAKAYVKEKVGNKG